MQRKPIMVSEPVYERLRRLRSALEKQKGYRVSFSATIDYLLKIAERISKDRG